MMLNSTITTITTTLDCSDRSSPSKVNFGLSMYVSLTSPPLPLSNISFPRFILLGILCSYLPQHYRIIARRSSEGLSPYFVLLGTTSGTCAFANILTLPASRQDLACCRELDGFDCAAGLLGIAQVGVQWGCFTIMYVCLGLHMKKNRWKVLTILCPTDFSYTSSSSPTPPLSLLPPNPPKPNNRPTVSPSPSSSSASSTSSSPS